MEIKQKGSWKNKSIFISIIIVVVYFLSFPIFRLGVQAGVDFEINESRLLWSFILTGFLIFIYLLFHRSNYNILINENGLFLSKRGIIGSTKNITINKMNLNYISYKNIGFEQIDIYRNKKRITKIVPTDFGRENYQLILEELRKIKDEGLPK